MTPILSVRHQLETARAIHEEDLRQGFGAVWIPEAIERKIPTAPRAWGWQWIFPASTRWKDPGGPECRDHLHESVVQRAVKNAAREAGLDKRVTCHTFRHSFATHLLERDHDIRTVKELLGHRDVTTTMIYTTSSSTAPAASEAHSTRCSPGLPAALKTDPQPLVHPALCDTPRDATSRVTRRLHTRSPRYATFAAHSSACAIAGRPHSARRPVLRGPIEVQVGLSRLAAARCA